MNFPTSTPNFGPGFGGRGASALFTGADGLRFEHHPAYSSPTLSVSFWMFLAKAPFGGLRTVLHKGGKDTFSPSILFNSDNRKLVVSVSTSEGSSSLESQTIVPLRRWIAVTYVQEGRLISLFVNGMHDRDVVIPSPHVLPNKEPLYIGKDPFHNGLAFYMDNLQIHDRVLSDEDIQAAAGDAFPGCDANAVSLGCQGCSLLTAKSKCAYPRRLCSTAELGSCAMHVAATLGWANLAQSQFWHVQSTFGGSADTSRYVGLCCR